MRAVLLFLTSILLVGCMGDPHVSIWVVNESADNAVVLMEGWKLPFLVPAHTAGVTSRCCTFSGSITVYRAQDCAVLGRDSKGSSLMVITIPAAGAVAFTDGASRNTLNDPDLQLSGATCSG